MALLIALLQRLPIKCHRFTRAFSAMATNDVQLTEVNTAGVITLNRPKALNALNHDMIKAIYPRLKEWSKNPKISHVVLEGSGEKAFCAGGDVVSLVKAGKAGDPHAADFFHDEYQVNHLLGTLSKPTIALLSGITMGGGVGLSVHCSYRVATEKAVFAMPETAIGLFPDVGGGHFLPRLEGKLGTFLALTGARLKGADVQKVGVATHFVDANKLEDLKLTLKGLPNASSAEITALLDAFQSSSSFNPSTTSILHPHLQEIDRHFGHTTVEAILSSLEAAGTEWATSQAKYIRAMSPTSLKITLRQMIEGAKMPDLGDCLRMEYRLGRRCLQDHDFFEGVTALLIDKNRKAQWKPDKLEDVTNEKVDWYFSPLTDAPELNLET